MAPFIPTGDPASLTLTTKGDILGFDTAENRLPVGADGALLVADSGAAIGLTWEAAQFRLMSRTIINQGTIAYTVPDDTRAILIECIGAGGGGGGGTSVAVSAAVGGGGGSGGYSSFFKTAPKLTAFVVAVGAGGIAGTNAGGTGGTGGDTSFDTGPNLCLAKGGLGGVGETGGTVAAFVAGGVAGAAASGIGDVKLDGTPGGFGQRITGLIGYSGYGGNGVGSVGGGGAQAVIAQGPGTVGGNFGAGASGGVVLNGGAAVVGGVGANGVIVVWEYA